MAATRSRLTASSFFFSSFWSAQLVGNGTATIWMRWFCESACGPVWSAVTPVMCLAWSVCAIWPTFAESAAVRVWPSLRLTTISSLVTFWLPLGNARSASFPAWTDSYFVGRKSCWSEWVSSFGASATAAAAATSQIAIVHHGCRTTVRPSHPNIGWLPFIDFQCRI